jgi:hypothetical protein
MESDIYSNVLSLTEKDYQYILNLVYRANRCEDLESFVSAVCPFIIKMFHSECVTFQRVKCQPRYIKIIESRSFKEDNLLPVEEKYFVSLYKDQYYQHSPLLKLAFSSHEKVLTIGESISSREWEKSEFFNEFIAPQHLYWEMFIPLRWKNNLEGMTKGKIIAPHL